MKSLQRGDFLDEVSRSLNAFNVQVEHFEQWFAELVEQLESKDLDKLGHEEYAHRVDQLMARREKQRPHFEEMIANGKNLVAKKDVTDVGVVRDKIKVCCQFLFFIKNKLKKNIYRNFTNFKNSSGCLNDFYFQLSNATFKN